VASTKAALPHSVESNPESQSGDSRDNKTTSNNSGCQKVVAAATLARISYDFSQSIITRTRLTSMESYARYFPMGYGQAPSTESVSEPRANEVVVFEEFFAAGLRMPPHPVLVDILHKFRVLVHQLMPNAIVKISKFIWVITSCGGRPTADVFAQHYELHYQNKKMHLEGSETTLAAQFGCIALHPTRFGNQAKLTPAMRNKWTSGRDGNWFYCKVLTEQMADVRGKGN
jgi:hypothetical protein